MLFLVGGLLAPVFSNVTDSILAKCLAFPIRYPFTVVANLSFVPVVFVLLSLVLFLSSWKAAISAMLNIIVWWGAYALSVSQKTSPWPINPILLAGALGGFGVTLSDSLCYPQLLSLRRLSCAALIGLAGAVPFAVLSMQSVRCCIEPAALGVVIVLGFGIWQASIGTYLYCVCTEREEQMGEVEGL
jgi:hypothetical protein